MSDPSTIHLPADVEDDLRCPLCDYNLRGLTEPRCPECGYRFAWDAIRAQARERREFFFEHHARHDRARAFVRTALATLLPRRFWRRLQPGVPYSTPMLWLYASAVLAVAALPVLVLLVRQQVSVPSSTDIAVWSIVQEVFGESMMAHLLITEPLALLLDTGRQRRGGKPAPGAVLAGRDVRGAQRISGVSMTRARIKPVHVLRCVVYSADALLWAGLFVTVVTAVAGVPIAQAWSRTTSRPSSRSSRTSSRSPSSSIA